MEFDPPPHPVAKAILKTNSARTLVRHCCRATNHATSTIQMNTPVTTKGSLKLKGGGPGSTGFQRSAEVLDFVVTITDAIFGPADVVSDGGFTVHVVP